MYESRVQNRKPKRRDWLSVANAAGLSFYDRRFSGSSVSALFLAFFSTRWS